MHIGTYLKVGGGRVQVMVIALYRWRWRGVTSPNCEMCSTLSLPLYAFMVLNDKGVCVCVCVCVCVVGEQFPSRLVHPGLYKGGTKPLQYWVLLLSNHNCNVCSHLHVPALVINGCCLFVCDCL